MVYLAPSTLASWMVLKVCYYDKKKTTQEQVEAYAGAIASPGGRNALLQTARQCIPKNFDEILAKLRNHYRANLHLMGTTGSNYPTDSRRATASGDSEFDAGSHRTLRTRSPGRKAGRNNRPALQVFGGDELVQPRLPPAAAHESQISDLKSRISDFRSREQTSDLGFAQKVLWAQSAVFSNSTAGLVYEAGPQGV